jgi:hypothetical protein
VSLHEINAGLHATLIASLLARTACAIQHGHYARALVRLSSAQDRIDAAKGSLSGEVLARASRLAEALAVIGGARETAEVRRG